MDAPPQIPMTGGDEDLLLEQNLTSNNDQEAPNPATLITDMEELVRLLD
jgi:hypothetical protein